MLTLSRKVGEGVVIGDNVRIHVMRIDGGKIRLGIEAPRDVPVHREEIYREIARQKDQEQGQAGSESK